MESCTDLIGAKIESKAEDSVAANPMTSARAWMSVGHVMSKHVVTVSPNQDVVDAALKMAQAGISCVIVTEKDTVVGILTETDFLRRVVVQGEGAYQTKIADIMSVSVEGVSADLSVLDAGILMRNKHVRRLPVLDGSQLVGIVTQTDLTRALTSFGHWRDVGDIMSRAVSEIQTGASVAMAAKLMNIGKISSIVVMKDDDVVGVFTQRDILKKVVARRKDPKSIKVEEVMSSPAVNVLPSYSVFSASRTMEKMNIRRLVIMEDNAVCGVVTQTDIFRAVEDMLHTEEEKQRRLLEESTSCIFSVDLQGVITYVNPAFSRLFDISGPQELINQPFLAERFWCNPKERAAFMEEHRNWGFAGQELALKTAQGQDLFITVFSHFTTGSNGEFNGREGVVCDITARKKAEVELEVTAKKLHQVECVFESIIASAALVNDMMPQADIQDLCRSVNSKEAHSPDKGTFPSAYHQDEIIPGDQAKLADIRRELQTLIEQAIHGRNITEMPQE
jgi:PAS domain S-box-containing protein